MSEQEDPGGATTASERLDLEKRRLECDKLRAEIAEVSLAWWKRPTYIGSVVTLAALLTGWLSGYFPAEREQLQKEIAGLKTARASAVQEALLVNSDLDRLKEERHDLKRQMRDLVLQAETTQGKIDDAYVRLKAASFNALYALSHIRGLGPFPDSERSKIEAVLEQLPPETGRAMREMLDRYKFNEEMVRYTEEDLNKLPKMLEAIPASKWAVELQPMPDGKLYQPGAGLSYNPDDGHYYAGQFTRTQQ